MVFCGLTGNMYLSAILLTEIFYLLGSSNEGASPAS
jgi:hypothetical protein